MKAGAELYLNRFDEGAVTPAFQQAEKSLVLVVPVEK